MRPEFVLPELLSTVGWAPRLHLGPAALAMRAGQSGTTLMEMGAHVLDGWRASGDPSTTAYDPRVAVTPIYRQSEIEALRLMPGEVHWSAPRIEGRWCVQPDDVALSKLAPVRAALVSSAAKRHPIDGNSVIVRGLPSAAAAWVAVCLNRAGYQEQLFAESGVLARVGLGALSRLRFPPTPAVMGRLSTQLTELIDEAIFAGESLHRVRLEAEEASSAGQLAERDLRRGEVFKRQGLDNDSWLPPAVALRIDLAALGVDHEWVAVHELASTGPRIRLGAPDDEGRALRLSDVADDLLVPGGAGAGAELTEQTCTRTLAKPLVPGEVLVSTLGRSFRAAYVDDAVPPRMHPMDGWARLRFRETPAAWALLLATRPAKAQAARLAIGSVQQFVPPEALRALRLPMPPREVRERWQRGVEHHHARRRTLDRRWAELLTELSVVFEAVHRPFMGRPSVPEVHE